MNVFASTLKYHLIYLLDGFGAEDIPVLAAAPSTLTSFFHQRQKQTKTLWTNFIKMRQLLFCAAKGYGGGVLISFFKLLISGTPPDGR